MTTEILYKIHIAENASYSVGKCNDQIHTFMIRDGKVKQLAKGYSYQGRGYSSMLAHAAKLSGPNFTTTFRIGKDNLDLNSRLAYGPNTQTD